MISTILGLTILLLATIPPFYSIDVENHKHWLWWIPLNLFWIIPIFTGINVQNSQGQYVGYVTAVEQTGAMFVGYNVYLKTDLTSSNEDVACIERTDADLIERLKEIQKNKESVVLEYEGVWQYKIGECPKSDWKIINIVEDSII